MKTERPASHANGSLAIAVGHLVPARPWVEPLRGLCFRCTVRPEVALIDLTGMAHHERLDACVAVLDGPGDDREAPKQLALHDVVIGAAGRVGPLGLQQLEAVPVIAGVLRVARTRIDEGRTERTRRLVRRGWPVQAVLL